MHDSHKLWATVAVFLIIMGLLVGMYLTASPDKLLKNPKNAKTASGQTVPQRQSVKQSDGSGGQNQAETGESAAETVPEEQSV